MKSARKATDQAIADLYKTLMAMQELMPTEALSALVTQLKGIELYARQYYLNDTPASSGTGTGSGTSSGSGTASGGGSTGNVTPVQPENGGGSGGSGGSGDE